jgi:hypothetical protein
MIAGHRAKWRENGDGEAEMKGGAVLAGAVIAGILLSGGVMAEPTGACVELVQRLERQAVINRRYGCKLAGEAWRGGATAERAAALRRCAADTRAGLARRAFQRSGELESCLIARLEAGRKSTPAVSQWSTRQREQADDSGAAADGGGLRQVGKTPADTGPGDVLPLGEGGTGDRRVEDQAAMPGGREESARRVRELLAGSPVVKPTSTQPPTDVSREFRAGLAWSYGGAIEGMHCVKWEEPSDPHDWDDNYLCSGRDFGFKWSYRGPIQGRGLRCIQVKEPSDPHFWHDNYFCWPRDLNVSFRFSSSGRIPNWGCVAVVEPSDPHTWADNFLCYRQESE